MGDFNVNMLQYDKNKDSQEFLDKMHSNFLLPYISSPSRVTPRSQTLIDIIFSNKIVVEFFREYNNNNFRILCPVSVVRKQQFA